MFKVINTDGQQVFADSSMKVAFDWAYNHKGNDGFFLLNAKGEKVIKFQYSQLKFNSNEQAINY